MTREEEIKIAASKYIENNSLDGYVQISDHKDSFIEGAEWADEHQQSPWISAKDDLPCNHEELINDDTRFGRFTKRVFVYYEFNQIYNNDYMYEINDKWKWGSCRNPKYWFPIPEPPKE